MNRDLFRIGRVTALVLLAALAACENSITSAPEVTSPQFNTLPPGKIRLQKFGPVGSTATFSVTATGGTLPLGETFTVDACEFGTTCLPVEIWISDDSDEHAVTITEIAHTGDLVLDRISVFSDIDGSYDIFSPVEPSVTVHVDGISDALVFFKNVGTPPDDDEGSAGCTPGFWKQEQHFQYWTAPYTPSTAFGSVFANAFPGKSLLQVVSNGGGGLEALGRHTVAALLNAASSDVDYGMTPAQVISAFNTAYASGAYETQKNIFEGGNERGCTAKD